jgi:cytochrome c peroxidase
MITGIRPDAETAVRAGFTHIQFAEIPEADAQAVDAYLKSLQPLPSPVAVDESMVKTIEQGKMVFESKGCTQCHYGPYFTDGNRHQIGEIEFEAGWDTPTLREVWRTAPYLHDGRAATLTDLFQVHGHGLGNKTIKKKDLKALITYIKSL